MTDGDARAERVLGTEQFGLQFGSEHDEGAGVFRILKRQELSAADTHLVNLQHVRGHAVDGRAAQAAVAPDFRIAPDDGSHAGDVRQAFERAGVVER